MERERNRVPAKEGELSLSPEALVLLCHLPTYPGVKSVRDLAGDVFDGDCYLQLRGKINRLLGQIRTAWGKEAIHHIHDNGWPPQQHDRYGLGKEFGYRRMRLMQENDIPEHLDREVAIP